MKKLLGILCMMAFALTSCSSDDDNNIPAINVNQMKGDYNGEMVINKNKEEKTAVSVNVDEKLNIASFPLEDIVKALVDEGNLEAALESLEATPYTSEYNAVVNGSKINFTLAAPSLTFDVLIGEKVEKVEVTFAKEAIGLFDGRDNTLTFALKAENATIGTTREEVAFEAIEYLFLPTKKVIVNVTEKDVEGTYNGEITSKQGETELKQASAVVAKDNVLAIDNFPMTEIVAALVGDDKTKVEEILKELDKVSYNLNYKAVVADNKDKIELNFEPKALSFKVTIDEVEKEVVVTIKAEDKGVYTVKESTLAFNFVADKVSVNKEELADFTAVEYSFPAVAKK